MDRIYSRRRFIRVSGGGVLTVLLANVPAEAAPLSFKITTKKRTSDVLVRVRMSVNAGPFKVTNHDLGNFYVPYGGSKNAEGSILGGIFYVFRMSIKDFNKDLEFFAEVSVAGQKLTKKIIEKI